MGQQSIDFIGGSVLFLALVVYVAFSVINVATRHNDQIVESHLHQEAWIASEKLVSNITEKTTVVNNTKLAYYQGCTNNVAFYTSLRDALQVDLKNAFRLTVTSYAVGIANGTHGENYTGTIESATTHMLAFNKTGANYSVVTIDETAYDDVPGDLPSAVTLDGVIFNVQSIDSFGQYVFLSNATLSCGVAPPLQTTISVVERYLVRNNQPMLLRVEYW